MEKKFNPNIDYSIRFDDNDVVQKIKVSLYDLEDYGLRQILKDKGFVFFGYEVLYRKIHFTNEPNFKINKKSTPKPSKPKHKNEFDDKDFRVYLDSIKDSYKDIPDWVDVKAENNHRAIIRALHSLKIYDFPSEWQSIKSLELF